MMDSKELEAILDRCKPGDVVELTMIDTNSRHFLDEAKPYTQVAYFDYKNPVGCGHPERHMGFYVRQALDHKTGKPVGSSTGIYACIPSFIGFRIVEPSINRQALPK